MLISVTKLTEKYIAYQYANFRRNGAYDVPHSAELMQQFYFRSPSVSQPKSLTDGAKTVEINFLLNANLAKIVQTEFIGLRLHRFVKNELCYAIENTLITGFPYTKSADKTGLNKIKSVIEGLFYQHEIEDEDFTIEAATKMFFRFRKRKARLRTINTAKYVRLAKKVVLQNGKISPKIRREIGNGDVDNLIVSYVSLHNVYFLTQKGELSTRLVNQAQCYIKRKCGDLSTQQIAEQENMSERNVRHNVRRFSLFLQSKPNLPKPF